MKRLVHAGLILAAVGVNVALLAANLSAASVGQCDTWRACQCYQNGSAEGCCTVCADKCNGCSVVPPIRESTSG